MNINHDDIISQARSIWADMTNEHPDVSEKKSYDENSLDLLSQNSNSVIAIVSLKGYKELYLSNNVEKIWGFSHQTNPIIGILQYIKMLTFDHALFPIIGGKWYLKCVKSLSFEEKLNQKIIFVGVKFKTRFGKVIRTFIHTSHLDEDADRNPVNVINSVQDISHFMKDDFWWMRFSYGENNEHIKYYHSESGKTFEGDIISDREKDILRLINQGMDSPEIAETLFLSLSTIHTHRKNMLARTGMKDVTALLQIALSIGMI
jgi:DNA-binding CsgD family transcriptional regulator